MPLAINNGTALVPGAAEGVGREGAWGWGMMRNGCGEIVEVIGFVRRWVCERRAEIRGFG